MRATFVVLLFAALDARADVITEFGGGWKNPRTTSYVLREDCHTVLSFDPRERDPAGFTRSCGGDNPIFVGWPVAWQSRFSDVWSIRAGWFHFSHWADGGPNRETHFDCVCASATFNWTEWRKRK